MKLSAFDEMRKKMLQIIDIVDKVPSGLKEEVFKTLLDTAKLCDSRNAYEEEISKLTDNGQLLKAFIKDKKPQSNIERTLLFVYFLKEKLELDEVCLEEIEACYKLSELDVPGNLAQNLRDTSSSRYGYIKLENGGFVVTNKGLAFCESEE